jgi:hypothetical protein
MDFGFNDEQQAIRDTAREMLTKRSPLSRVREHAEAGTRDDELWSEICELGWPGIALPEDHGGQGLGTVELVILCEELGYACAAVPFLSNAHAGLLIAGNGSDEQKSRWLRESPPGRPAPPPPSSPPSRRPSSTPTAPRCSCSPPAPTARTASSPSPPRRSSPIST